jgi:hypothetical protein
LQAGNTGRENFLEANFLQDGYPVISIFSSWQSIQVTCKFSLMFFFFQIEKKMSSLLKPWLYNRDLNKCVTFKYRVVP